MVALPLVGEGHAYRQAGVTVVGPQEMLPSGGLIHAGADHLISDLQSGLARSPGNRFGTLRQWRPKVVQVVHVGDILPGRPGRVVLADDQCCSLGRRASDWFVPYSTLETRLFRWPAVPPHSGPETSPPPPPCVARGVSASWVGNADDGLHRWPGRSYRMAFGPTLSPSPLPGQPQQGPPLRTFRYCWKPPPTLGQRV